MRLPIALVVAALLVPPAVAAESLPRFGIVDGRGDGWLCVTLPEPRIGKPRRVVAAFFDPPQVAAIRIVEAIGKPCSAATDGLGVAYRAELVRGEKELPLPAVGIVVTGGPYVPLAPGPEGPVRLRNKAGEIVGLRLCASSEGLHLTAWKGPKRVWHEYYYLGYDVEPTCTEEEWRDSTR